MPQETLGNKQLLQAVVFVTGAVVLIIEITALRILSPYYGNTIFTASSVISVILAALSLGYYTGGKLADKQASLRTFFGIIFLSGLCLLSLHLIGAILLPSLSVTLSISGGPLISSVVLFFLPALLLGTLSPYAIKLYSVYFPDEGIGSVSGKVFFWSTLGSITGSLLTGFLLIPAFGINQIVLGSSVVLFTLGLIPLLYFGFRKSYLRKILILFLTMLSATWLLGQVHGNVLYSRDGVYERIIILDAKSNGSSDRPVRFFYQDRSSSGAMFLDSDDPTDLVHEYSKYYSLYKIFTQKVENALVIGGGAYSIPKALLHELPQATVDVSEIEPSLPELAKKYFKLEDEPRLNNFIEDGRHLLGSSDKKYDLIFSDVYYSLYSIPSHFTTREFFTLAKERLSRDGILIANVIGDLGEEKPSFTMSEIKTFQTVFPNSYFFATKSPDLTGSQNIIFVGYNSNSRINFSDPTISELQNKLVDVSKLNLSPHPIFTDNYSPVEYFVAKTLQKRFN